MEKRPLAHISSFLLLILLTVASPSWAAASISEAEANCPSIDLRKDQPYYSNSRDQKQTGWCYAYAGADLISAKVNKAVSVFDLALRNAAITAKVQKSTTKNLITVMGGSLVSVAKIAGKYGVCSARKLSADHPLAIEALTEAENLAIAVQRLRLANQLSPLELQKLISMHSQKLRFIFPTSNDSEIVRAYESINPKAQFPILSVVNKICEGNVVFADLSVGSDGSDGKLETIKTLLKAGKPVFIDYIARALRNLSVPIETLQAYRHGSTVIGMRFNKVKNSCELLVRNSYGDRVKLMYDPKLRSQAHNANLWLSEKLAGELIQIVSWLE